MKSTAHGANLVQLTRFRFVNAFFVREDDGLTLVDTLIARSADLLVEAARVAGAPIVRIVVTHAHGDHAGSVDALVERVPGAELLFPVRDARFLRGDMSLDPGEPEEKLEKLPGSYVTVEARPTRELSAGDRVGSLEVVAAPGHTPGQIALLDTRDRTLIAADAWSTLGGVAPSSRKNPRSFGLPGIGTWHAPTAQASAQALRDLEPARLAVGHGPTVENPAAVMDAALAKAQASLQR